MKVQLYCQFEAEIVTDTGDILRLPADYAEFEIGCSLIKLTDWPDVLVVDKTVRLNGTAYSCRTHVSSLDLLECLAAASPACSTSVLEAGPGPKAADLECLLAGAHIWSDDRDHIYFCFQRSRAAKPVLYYLRKKYYSAYIDLFVHCNPQRQLRGIYGRFQSKVLLEAVSQPNASGRDNVEPEEIGPEDLLWIQIPEATLLWSNNLALYPENGREHWSLSRRPLLPRFRKVEG